MESRVAVEATVSTASHTVQRLLVTSSMRVHTAQTETPPRDAAGAVSALWRREVFATPQLYDEESGARAGGGPHRLDGRLSNASAQAWSRCPRQPWWRPQRRPSLASGYRPNATKLRGRSAVAAMQCGCVSMSKEHFMRFLLSATPPRCPPPPLTRQARATRQRHAPPPPRPLRNSRPNTRAVARDTP